MLPGVPGSLMRLFLPKAVANGLGIPRRIVGDWMVKLIIRLFGWLDSVLLHRFLHGSRALRSLSMRLLDALIEWERGGARQPFRLPDSLDWYERPARRSLGQLLIERSARR